MIQEWIEQVKEAKRNGRYAEALAVLEDWMVLQESEGAAVAPWPYEQAAIVHRKLGDRESEVAVLKRFAKQKHAPGVKPRRLLERLAKLVG